jgi:uncharacterized repeat protein (TIGR02543 family)
MKNTNVQTGTLTLYEARFSENSAKTGGAINNLQAVASIDHSDFTKNTATNEGGAIRNLNTGVLTITNSLFSENKATLGGAVHNLLSKLTLDGSDFFSNEATQKGGAIHHQGNYTTTVELNLHIRDAEFTNNYAQQEGGAIYNRLDQAAEISESTFNSNHADTNGGAIFFELIKVSITDTDFTGNWALGNGGVIHASNSSINYINTSFELNEAGGDAGALYHHGGTIDIFDSDFLSNHSDGNGGAIVNNQMAITTINQSRVLDNNADGHGGAIANTNTSVSLLNNSSVAGNYAQGDGGAIYNDLGFTGLESSLLTGNQADNQGGAVYLRDRGVIMSINATIAGNRAGNGGGSFFSEGDVGSAAILSNNIIWGNSSPLAVADSEQLTFKSNLIQGCKPGGVWNSALCGVDDGNFTDADPLFVNPISYTNAPNTLGDYHLRRGSPAIDVGANSLISNTIDLDLNPRLFGAQVDLGAYESLFFLDVNVVGSGTASYSPVQNQYQPNSTVILTATANPGWTFVGWSGDLTSTAPQTSILINETKDVTATFSNDLPTADAGSDQSVLVGSLVTLDASASSDADPTQTLSYTWTQTAGTAVSLSDPSAVSPTFTAPNTADILTFQLVVTDNLGAMSVADTVTITVTNDAPIANAGVDQSVLAGASVTLDGSGSSDPDGHTPLSYAWTQSAGTAVTLSDPSAVSPSFTAPTTAGSLTFELIVTDSMGLASAADSVTITVTNAAPIADAGADQVVLAGELVTLDASASSDPDGHTPLSYGWTQIAGTPVSLSDSSAIAPTFTAPNGASVLRFSLVVTDSMGLASAADTVTITVNSAAAPIYQMHLPLIQHSPAELRANLVVTALKADQDGLQLQIKNTGNAATQSAFWVDLYINPSQIPQLNTPWQDIAPAGAVWAVTQTLAPGESLLLTLDSPSFAIEYSLLKYQAGDQLYAIVDSYNANSSYGAISESNEQDNRFGPVSASASAKRVQPTNIPNNYNKLPAR